MRNVEGVSFRK